MILVNKIRILHKKDGSYCLDAENLDRLKALHGSLLGRKVKADRYFNDDNIPEEEKDRYKFDYTKIIHQIATAEILLNKLGVNNVE